MRTHIRFLFGSVLTLIVPICNSAVIPTFFPPIDSWEQSEIKVWGPDNLYTPIDGAADLFLAYNFEEMQSIDYTRDSSYISVEVYRHKTPLDAFGVYSQERPDRDLYFDIGVQGYREDEYIHFLVGRYYIKIRTAMANEQSQQAMKKIAAEQARILADDSEFPALFKCFPEEGRKPFSEKYIYENILGFSFLHSSFEVDYQKDNTRYTLYIPRGSDEEDASKMLTEYLQYLKLPTERTEDDFYPVNDIYTGKVYMMKNGRYLICSRGKIGEDESRILFTAISNCLAEMDK